MENCSLQTVVLYFDTIEDWNIAKVHRGFLKVVQDKGRKVEIATDESRLPLKVSIRFLKGSVMKKTLIKLQTKIPFRIASESSPTFGPETMEEEKQPDVEPNHPEISHNCPDIVQERIEGGESDSETEYVEFMQRLTELKAQKRRVEMIGKEITDKLSCLEKELKGTQGNQTHEKLDLTSTGQKLKNNKNNGSEDNYEQVLQNLAGLKAKKGRVQKLGKEANQKLNELAPFESSEDKRVWMNLFQQFYRAVRGNLPQSISPQLLHQVQRVLGVGLTPSSSDSPKSFRDISEHDLGPEEVIGTRVTRMDADNSIKEYLSDIENNRILFRRKTHFASLEGMEEEKLEKMDEKKFFEEDNKLDICEGSCIDLNKDLTELKFYMEKHCLRLSDLMDLMETSPLRLEKSMIQVIKEKNKELTEFEDTLSKSYVYSYRNQGLVAQERIDWINNVSISCLLEPSNFDERVKIRKLSVHFNLQALHDLFTKYTFVNVLDFEFWIETKRNEWGTFENYEDLKQLLQYFKPYFNREPRFTTSFHKAPSDLSDSKLITAWESIMTCFVNDH